MKTVNLNKRYDKDEVISTLKRKIDSHPFGNITLGEIIDTVNNIDDDYPIDLSLISSAPDLLEATKCLRERLILILEELNTAEYDRVDYEHIEDGVTNMIIHGAGKIIAEAERDGSKEDGGL